MTKSKPYVAIISARRPNSVEKMSEFAKDAVWFVAAGETDDYKKAGAKNIIEAGGLVEARNLALDMAFKQGRACVQLSDDLTKLQMVDDFLNCFDVTLDTAIDYMSYYTKQYECKLAGVALTANTFYYSPKTPVKAQHFIVGDFIYVEPSNIRFDSNLKLKEDYDFTAQHIKEYGSVARCDFIFASFKHRTNAGGAVSYRTAEVEQEAIAILKKKWGPAILDNAKRPNEILFKGKFIDGCVIKRGKPIINKEVVNNGK